MAEKETTSGNMFERAGYALGQSEAPTTGSNYAKDWVDSYQQVTKADRAGAKLANLLAMRIALLKKIILILKNIKTLLIILIMLNLK